METNEDKQEKGRRFEEIMHNFLMLRLPMEYHLFRETDVSTTFGFNVKAIDNMIVIPNYCIICIQYKWWNSRKPTDGEVFKFQKSVNVIGENMGLPCFCLYITKDGVAKNGLDEFSKANNLNKNSGINIRYFEYHSEDVLELMEFMMFFLYKIRIFMYENDGSAIICERDFPIVLL